MLPGAMPRAGRFCPFRAVQLARLSVFTGVANAMPKHPDCKSGREKRKSVWV